MSKPKAERFNPRVIYIAVEKRTDAPVDCGGASPLGAWLSLKSLAREAPPDSKALKFVRPKLALLLCALLLFSPSCTAVHPIPTRPTVAGGEIEPGEPPTARGFYARDSLRNGYITVNAMSDSVLDCQVRIRDWTLWLAGPVSDKRSQSVDLILEYDLHIALDSTITSRLTAAHLYAPHDSIAMHALPDSLLPLRTRVEGHYSLCIPYYAGQEIDSTGQAVDVYLPRQGFDLIAYLGGVRLADTDVAESRLIRIGDRHESREP